MINIYRQVQESLLGVLSSRPSGHNTRRMNTLCGLIIGMISKGKSSLSVISSGIIRDIDGASKTTAAKRFVSNKWIDSHA